MDMGMRGFGVGSGAVLLYVNKLCYACAETFVSNCWLKVSAG